MLKRIILLLVNGCLTLLWIEANTTFATSSQSADGSLPIEIHSDFAEFDDKKGTATYRGHVVMQQGSRHLDSDTLIILRNQHGKIESLVAMGKPSHFHAQSEPEKPPIQGQAKIIQYFPKQDKLILQENAELVQNGDKIQGDKLVYLISTHVLTSLPVSGKSTTIILAPRIKD